MGQLTFLHSAIVLASNNLRAITILKYFLKLMLKIFSGKRDISLIQIFVNSSQENISYLRVQVLLSFGHPLNVCQTFSQHQTVYEM